MRLVVKEVARFFNSSVYMVNRQPSAKGIVFRYENNKRFRESVEGGGAVLRRDVPLSFAVRRMFFLKFV